MNRHATMAILAISLIIPATATASSADLGIGGTAGYIWWKPAWTDAKTKTIAFSGVPVLLSEDAQDFNMSSYIMGGPIISIGFLERWSVQSLFNIGKFMSRASGLCTYVRVDPVRQNIVISKKNYRREILKWDSDTSIGCTVHKMVKIFGGFKYQGYRYQEHMRDDAFLNQAVFVRVLSDNVDAYGGGFGLGLTIPVIDNLYIMTSASAIALWSKEKMDASLRKSHAWSTAMGCFYFPIFDRKGKYFSYGGTATLSLAYLIEKINTTISLGGKYQVLYNRQHYSRSNPFDSVAINIIDKQYDHFFGVTLSAIYTFHLGKNG